LRGRIRKLAGMKHVFATQLSTVPTSPGTKHISDVAVAVAFVAPELMHMNPLLFERFASSQLYQYRRKLRTSGANAMNCDAELVADCQHAVQMIQQLQKEMGDSLSDPEAQSRIQSRKRSTAPA
jgi:hypothetical protein